MKKNNIFLLLCALVAIIAVMAVLLPKKEVAVDKLKSIQVTKLGAISADISPAANSKEVAVTAVAKAQDEFKKCFKKESHFDNLENLKNLLLEQKDYSAPILNEENYELVTADNANLIVQHIPQEENKNQVRVFSINPTDGMPDRIKDFPYSGGDVSLRLKGALTLGTIKGKTSSTIQNAYDGSMLSLENRDDKIIRLHLITNNFDFECKNQSCICLTKEY